LQSFPFLALFVIRWDELTTYSLGSAALLAKNGIM